MLLRACLFVWGLCFATWLTQHTWCHQHTDQLGRRDGDDDSPGHVLPKPNFKHFSPSYFWVSLPPSSTEYCRSFLSPCLIVELVKQGSANLGSQTAQRWCSLYFWIIFEELYCMTWKYFLDFDSGFIQTQFDETQLCYLFVLFMATLLPQWQHCLTKPRRLQGLKYLQSSSLHKGTWVFLSLTQWTSSLEGISTQITKCISVWECYQWADNLAVTTLVYILWCTDCGLLTVLG